ncbi:MAG: hypothetical protein RLZZ165_1318, partial [Bacteroidota bacterium]
PQEEASLVKCANSRRKGTHDLVYKNGPVIHKEIA